MKYNLARDIISELASYFVPKQIIFTEKKNPHGTVVGIIVVNLFIEFR